MADNNLNDTPKHLQSAFGVQVMHEEPSIGNDLINTIKSDDSISLAKEIAEVGLDSVFDEGVLRDLPVVGSMLAVAKIGLSVRDRLLVRKIYRFLTAMQQLPVEERINMISKIESDSEFGMRLGENLIELLDRIDNNRKPEMIAAIFAAYAKGEIDVLMLQRLNHSVEHLPSYEIPQVGRFLESEPRERANLGASLQAIMNAGLSTPGSAWNSIAYSPNEVCETFVRLGLDRVSH